MELKKILIAIGALVYFLLEPDLIPGWFDDLAVIFGAAYAATR